MDKTQNYYRNTPPPSKETDSLLFYNYTLSKVNESNFYETGFRFGLKPEELSSYDSIIFDKYKGYCSTKVLEICRGNDITDVLILARELMEKYSLLAFFIFEEESKTWYTIQKNQLGFSISVN